MKTLLRWLLAAGIVVGLAVATVAVVLAYLPFPAATIVVDGETLSLSRLDGWETAAVLTAAAVALVSLVLASALGTIAGILVALLAALLAVAAIVAVLLLLACVPCWGWLLWLQRGPRARHRRSAAS